jgi:hypothetical protein
MDWMLAEDHAKFSRHLLWARTTDICGFTLNHISEFWSVKALEPINGTAALKKLAFGKAWVSAIEGLKPSWTSFFTLSQVIFPSTCKVLNAAWPWCLIGCHFVERKKSKDTWADGNDLSASVQHYDITNCLQWSTNGTLWRRPMKPMISSLNEQEIQRLQYRLNNFILHQIRYELQQLGIFTLEIRDDSEMIQHAQQKGKTTDTRLERDVRSEQTIRDILGANRCNAAEDIRMVECRNISSRSRLSCTFRIVPPRNSWHGWAGVCDIFCRNCRSMK